LDDLPDDEATFIRQQMEFVSIKAFVPKDYGLPAGA
jgi:hypothetical protein